MFRSKNFFMLFKRQAQRYLSENNIFINARSYVKAQEEK